MEHEVQTNPWNVLSLEAFHFYNCPECGDKYSTREQFIGHAMISHQKARNTLPTILNDNNVQSIQVVEPEVIISDLESNSCIEPKYDPGENSTDVSNVGLEPESDTENGQTNLDDIFHTNTFEFEDTNNEKVEPMSDAGNDENYDTSNIELEFKSDIDENFDVSNIETTSDTEMDENCNASNIQPIVIKISKKEKIDEQMKSRKRTVEIAFQVNEGKESEENFEIDPKTNRYKCKQCLRDFAKKLRVKEHFQTVHQGNPFKCDQCSKTYFSSGGLRTHIQIFHPNLET